MSRPPHCSARRDKTGTKTLKQARHQMADVRSDAAIPLPGGTSQTVLVLQGGGALGAYQVGVYQALHEAGIEPDWVIGTSIGAINASIIAGNTPAERMPRLQAFWQSVEHGPL